jgi:hypothetical protein
MEVNEMINRYVREVGRHLPRRTRADIEMELRSLLHDSLDELAAKAGMEPTPKLAAELLRDFGKPEAMAANYRPEQHLIGPRLFPVYKQALTIMAVIISALHVAGLIFMLLNADTAVLGQTTWGWFGSLFQSLLVYAGLITVIFAIVERTEVIDWEEETTQETEWDPFELPPAEDPNRINRFELGFEMLWTAAFIILFNFYPEWIGIANVSGEETAVFPLLAAAFAVHIPWLTLLWTLELALKGFVLTRGRWTRLTRWLEFGLVPLNLYILNRIRTGGAIFTIPGLTAIAKAILMVVIVIVVLDGLYKLIRLLTGRPFSPKEIFKSRPA